MISDLIGKALKTYRMHRSIYMWIRTLYDQFGSDDIVLVASSQDLPVSLCASVHEGRMVYSYVLGEEEYDAEASQPRLIETRDEMQVHIETAWQDGSLWKELKNRGGIEALRSRRWDN